MIRARPGRREDAAAMGRIHVRAWQAAYRGLMPVAYLEGLSVEERGEMWEHAMTNLRDRRQVIVAERDEIVAGFAVIGPVREGANAGVEGELYSINVDPDHWRVGVGTTLIDSVHRGLAQLGFVDAVLWVHPENQRARRFYERVGWVCDDAIQDAEVLGVVVPEVRYRRAQIGAT